MEEIQEKKRIDIAKLKKTGAVVLPSIFTIANMAFGFFGTVGNISAVIANSPRLFPLPRRVLFENFA